MCEEYLFTERGLEIDHRGEPRKRTPKIPTQCRMCPKVPDWAKQVEEDYRELRKLASDMTDANRRAYRFYTECKATGRFPDDAIVRWYSGLIREVEDAHAQHQRDKQHNELALLVALTEARLKV